MKFRTSLIIVLWAMLATPNARAQALQDDIVIKALQDEIKSSMDGLHLAGTEKPFFIMLGVSFSKTYTIHSQLGSIRSSTAFTNSRRTTSRVLVGDYGFNDESLEDDLTSASRGGDISLPEEPDYFGIRRSFWSSLDHVYRDGARHFENHKQVLRESGKKLAQIPHRTFAKSNAVTIAPEVNPFVFDVHYYEALAKRLSSRFLKYPDMANSDVLIQYVEGTEYLANTEGTITRVPFQKAYLVVSGHCRNDEGDNFSEQTTYHTVTPDKFSEKEITAGIDAMITNLPLRLAAPVFEDEYTGPVLVMGDFTAPAFFIMLQGGRGSLTASDWISPINAIKSTPNPNTLDSKIGKLVVHESITVKAKPALKVFQGVPLTGAFAVDGEGIVPPDQLTLIDKGILKTMLNNRTLTDSLQHANGFRDGPGVLEVTVDRMNTDAELKSMLIAKAKEKGLDYALIVRESPSQGSGVSVIKVSLADGKEELLRNAAINALNIKSLKRILGSSARYVATNIPGGFSLIAPDAILLEELEVKASRRTALKEEQYVSNPLKK